MMMRAIALVVVSTFIPAEAAFVPTTVVPQQRRPTIALSLSSQNDNDNEWKLPNDFPQFLNQCAIQSWMTVARSLRDLQTIRWVDNFTQPVILQRGANARLTGTTVATNAITSDNNVKNPEGDSQSKLLTFHGVGAMNTTKFPTWQSYFEALLLKPVEVYVVQSSGVQVKDYELEMNPASLCTRIISVREQIAREFANDLGVVAEMGQHTMDSYWDYLDNQRDSEEEEEDGTANENESDEMDTTADESSSGADEMKPSSSSRSEVTMSSGADSSPRILPPHNLVFLEYSLDNLGDMAPSALRKGNFDLVTLLATQESILRILNNKQQSDKVGKDFDIYQRFLLDFYAERMESHFAGIQRYGRADDFLEELLFSSVSEVVDTVRVAEMILNERREVALEWQARSKDVPNDHIDIKRLQLNRLMESYNTQDIPGQ